MATIKSSGHGLAVQCTKQARGAGLVEETGDEASRLADTWVYGVDGLLLVIDKNRVDVEDRAELVASAARDSGAIYQGAAASMHVAGDGYKAQLPGALEVGIREGDAVSFLVADHVLVVTDRSHDATRLAEDLATIRDEQTDN